MTYITVTEMPGNKATKENIEMLYTRYKWASQFIEGKDVLEVACGAGQGLGYLAKKAKKVVAKKKPARSEFLVPVIWVATAPPRLVPAAD